MSEEVTSKEDTVEETPAAYAVVRVGAHTHRVSVGDTVEVEWDNTPFEKEGDAPEEIVFDQVLLSRSADQSINVGTPTIEGATVTAKVRGLTLGDKVVSYKKIRRHGYHKKQGHRQGYLSVEISQIP
jgi:large subunit ribosomal protein L21